MDGLPLSGTTVVEFCHSVAGPYAASILADLGADVIKVESPGKGDYARDWGPPSRTAPRRCSTCSITTSAGSRSTCATASPASG